MRSNKPRRLKLVDDNDPIWYWVAAICILAFVGLCLIIYSIINAIYKW